MSNHSPLPWRYNFFDGSTFIYDKNQELVCENITEANSRLITHITEVYELLPDILKYLNWDKELLWSDRGDEDPDLDELIDKLNNLIARIQ